jgi:lipopolysaccharide/colanic/teichoic acid biosynthesis glycosyltransferase
LFSIRKRTIDLLISTVGLIALGIIFIPIAQLIKIDSRGSVIYRQRRIGLDGKTFMLFKFRTMSASAEESGVAVFAAPNDVRVTRVGRLLRRTYLDEFPQWLNVFKGDMSVVGPRPERPQIAEDIIKHYPGFRNRTTTKPGVTGLAQVEYGYVSTIADSKHKLSYDQLYIERASLRVDLWIIFRTLSKIVTRRGT